MTYEQFIREFSQLPENPKAKDIQLFIKELIRRKENVDFLEPFLPEHPAFYQPYFEVSLAAIPDIDAKLRFIEQHFSLLTEWWQADMLLRIVGDRLSFDKAMEKAKLYIQSDSPVVRRWGYTMFIPRLTRDETRVEALLSLVKDDTDEYVIMAEANLLSFLAITDPETLYGYLSDSTLPAVLRHKAIEKITSSRQISVDRRRMFQAL